MDQNIELLRSWGQGIAKNITAQVINELQQTPFTESIEDYELGINNLWKKVCFDHSSKSYIYGLPDYVAGQVISKQVKQLQPLEKIALYEAIDRKDNGIGFDQSEVYFLKSSNQSGLDEDNIMTILHCLDFVVDSLDLERSTQWATFKTNPYELKEKIDFSRISHQREDGIFVLNAESHRRANEFEQKEKTGEKLEHLILRGLGQKALDSFCLKVIEELKTSPITQGSEFSSDEADIATFWDELCLQSQGTRNFAWEDFLEDIESTIYHMLKQLSLEEQFLMSIMVEDFEYVLDELEHERFESADSLKSLISSDETTQYIRHKVYQAASIEKHPIVSRILG